MTGNIVPSEPAGRNPHGHMLGSLPGHAPSAGLFGRVDQIDLPLQQPVDQRIE